MAKEYIERDTVLDICEDAREEGFGDIRGVMFRVRLLNAADVVEVVRCAECKHWGGVTFGNVCRRWSFPHLGSKNCTKPNGFCSYGERRTDG